MQQVADWSVAMRVWGMVAALVVAGTPGLAVAAPGDTYAPAAPSDGGAKAPVGWGMFAIDKGRSLDLAAHNLDWAQDSTAASDDVAVGVGWRGARASAVIGYEHHDDGPRPDPRRAAVRDPVPWHGPSVLGVTFSLRR